MNPWRLLGKHAGRGDRGDAVVPDAHVAREPRVARAVDDSAACDHDVVGGTAHGRLAFENRLWSHG